MDKPLKTKIYARKSVVQTLENQDIRQEICWTKPRKPRYTPGNLLDKTLEKIVEARKYDGPTNFGKKLENQDI